MKCLNKLTKKMIDQISCADGKRTTYWDTEIKGFGIRISPSGRKSFVLSYRIEGVKKLYKIGDYRAWTIEEARAEAKKKIGMIANYEDPMEIRKSNRQSTSFAGLAHQYLERHSKPLKTGSWKDDERRITKILVPEWGALQITKIRHLHVLKVHQEVGARAPVEANRILTLVHGMFEKARAWEYIPESHKNPAKGVERFPEVTRERFVTKEELPRLADAIQAEKNLYARAAIWLYLLTGLRKSEILKAKWSDVSLEMRKMRIEQTKNGQPVSQHLSEPAIALLHKIPREKDNEHIIVGRIKGSHLVNIRKAWLRVRSSAGLNDVRIHDLRRTLGSWMAQEGHSLHLIGKVLNHRSSETTKIYARLQEQQVHEALESHGQNVANLLPLTSAFTARRASN